MSKTLWQTIQIEVPKEMIKITKKDKVVVKKSLTINKQKNIVLVKQIEHLQYKKQKMGVRLKMTQIHDSDHK